MLLDIRSASGGVVGFGAGVSANSVSSLMPLPFQQLIAIVAEGTVLFLVLYVAACGILRLVPAGRQLAQLIWSSQVVEWFVTAAIGLAAIALLVGLVQLGWAAIQGKVSSFWVVLAFVALGLLWRKMSTRPGTVGTGGSGSAVRSEGVTHRG